MAGKVYDFNLAKVQNALVSHLRSRRRESTVSDLVAGTGLPKYQVEQGLKAVLAEYAGHLKVSESGELIYYFPWPMRSTLHGFGPAFRRGIRAFGKGAAAVLSFVFKVWIVVMLVGYFLVFLALALAALVGGFAISVGGNRDGRGRRRGPSGSGQGMALVMRLLDSVMRMWFWSNLTGTARGREARERGKPFYRSVFSFVFGDPDPNREYDSALTRYALSYLRARRGVITLEEVMAMTGREPESAQQLLNRWVLEFEGDPRATDAGTVVYAFPELLRTTSVEQLQFGAAASAAAPARMPTPFSSNKPRTNGWIIFFNLFNLIFGGYFLFVTLAPQAAVQLGPNFPFLYRVAVSLLETAGIANPVPILSLALGAVPLVFSALMYLVPLVRRRRLARKNEVIRTEGLARRIYARVLADPSRVDPREVRPSGGGMDPARFEAVRRRIFDRFAGAKGAEPEALPDGGFVYRFTDVEREQADLQRYRTSVDLAKLETGPTVFDSGT
ncbi:MAG: hypothetical protein A2177_00675 [Spirochaetes bacterium RBG_13_68_11]|nr:MAG: hypothetical protein A2177_00675 [Spirochaetes bacterium RBG_13_68_11]